MNSPVTTMAALALAATAAATPAVGVTHYIFFSSSNDAFGITGETSTADTQIQSAIAAAAASTATCENGAFSIVTSWISNKNMKEATYIVDATQECCDNGWSIIHKKLIASFEADKTNKIAIKENGMGPIKIDDCLIADSSPAAYGCAGSADVSASCKSILCNVGTTCSKDEQCGTKKCASVTKVDDEKVHECSGVGAISSILAVGAAFAVAAVSFL